MRCRKIRDLIITDYMDNEISPANKDLVDRHLKDCGRCREYKAVLTRSAIEPFRKIEAIKPSDSVWRGIKAAIQPERRPSLMPGFFYVPERAFALATVAVMIFFLGILAKTYMDRQETAGLDSPDQTEYFIGYGTAIEEYFL
jgi:predicted anti-sigma-YlaC factor YlaD